MEQKYYREKTPSGFGIAIKIKDVLFSAQSKYQKIEVLQSESSLGKILTLNDLMFVNEGDYYNYSEMITHVPMLSNKMPKAVLVIGGGTGTIAKEVLKYDTVEKVVIVDIDEMVIETSKKYLPSVAGCLDDKKVKIEITDAIEYVKNKENEFDVIMITSPDPLGPGVGLYTKEFYLNIKKNLKTGGILVVQSESPVSKEEKSRHLYQILMDVFSIVKTYTSPVPTYPGSRWVWAFCSNDTAPLQDIDINRYNNIVKTCKLFNLDYAQEKFKEETILDDL